MVQCFLFSKQVFVTMATIRIQRTQFLLSSISKSNICCRTLTTQHNRSFLVSRPVISRLTFHPTNSNIVSCRYASSIHCINHHNSYKKRLLQGDLRHQHFSISHRGVATEPSAGELEHVVAAEPVQLAQTVFEQCHTLTGLPWWGTIIATTLCLRLALTLPLAIYSKHISAKVERIQPELIQLAQKEFVRRYKNQALSEKWSKERITKTVMFLVRLLLPYSEMFMH